jgi:hypothetical protein
VVKKNDNPNRGHNASDSRHEFHHVDVTVTPAQSFRSFNMSDQTKGQWKSLLASVLYLYNTSSVVDKLKECIATCEAATASLKIPVISSAQDDLKLSVLRNDLLSLLSLIYNAGTKTSLALKPSSPTYSAALLTIEDLSRHTAALLHCTSLFTPDVFGATLRDEVVSLSAEIFGATQAFLEAFLAVENTDSRAGQGKAGEEYMIRIASLHAIIDRARSSNGLSDSNLTAVRKLWLQHRSSLEDGLTELTEMITEAENDDGEEESFDDGWDEIGLGGASKLAGVELERAKKVQSNYFLQGHIIPNPLVIRLLQYSNLPFYSTSEYGKTYWIQPYFLAGNIETPNSTNSCITLPN